MVNFHPSREFWESSLEMPVDHWLHNFQNEEMRKNWLYSLSGKQLNIIFQQFQKNDGISLQQKRTILISCSESLFNYYLLSHFNHSKLESAVVEVAKSVLTEALIEQFLCKNHKYDKNLYSLFYFILIQNQLNVSITLIKYKKKDFHLLLYSLLQDK